jgi:hypothetical protein
VDGFRQAAAWITVTLASCAAVLPAVAAPPGAHAAVAVYPPWWNRSRALAAAEATAPAIPGAAPFAVLVQGLDASGPGRLRRGGALLILSADTPWCSEAKG